jgi:hypothetical protein
MLKKILYLTLLFAFVVSFSSVQSQIVKEKSGGYARLQSMGSNPYIIDPFFMTVNPAWGAEYDNFIFGDLGSTQTAFGNDGAGQFIGANFRVSPSLTVGAILTRADFNGTFSIGHLDPDGLVDLANGFIGGGLIPLNNNIELMTSYKSGGNVFGFGLAYAASSSESNPAGGSSTEGSASQIGMNFGFLGKMSGRLLLDVGLSLTFPSASYKPATGSEASLSQTRIALNTRGFYNLSKVFKVVPAITFMTTSGSADDGTEETDLNSTTIFIVGVGILYESGDFLFSGGPSIISASDTEHKNDFSPELTRSATLFPTWNIGAEWGMLDWLVARFGYVSITGSISTETQASSTTVNETIATFYGPTGAYIGLGLKLGNLSLDGTVNSDVLRQGLNNIAAGGATFSYLSLSVAF